MSPKSKLSHSRLLTYLVALVIAAAGYWYRGHSGHDTPPSLDPASLPANLSTGFEVLSGCRVVNNPGNDGDSFRVMHLGEEHTFRLYFVDCPETSNRYPDRIAYQGKYFGGLSPSQTISVGEEGKRFTLDLLETHPFAILTRWEKVMKSYRFHAFVMVETGEGSVEYLSEILVRNGLARIYTLGADLPDGSSEKAFKRRLQDLEKTARTNRKGAWRHSLN